MVNSSGRGQRDGPPLGEAPIAQATDYERQLFKSLVRPSDSYTANGEYWASLPWTKRFTFVRQVDKEESRREMAAIKDMIRRNPLSPISWYMRNAVLPGAGLLLEGYVLFSIGNLAPLFESVWKSCWKEHETCDKQWVYSVSYLEIVGIMVGQVLVGFIGDWIGRRWGLIQDAAIMAAGLALLTAMWGTTLQAWVILYAWALFFYGIGVGGEYPITATSSMENAAGSGKVSSRDDRLHRGRKVTMAFLMQGWGQFLNQVILLILLAAWKNSSGDPPKTESAGHGIFRISFAIPLLGTIWLTWYRAYRMRGADKNLEMAKRKRNVTGYDTLSLKMTVTHFSGRLLATAGGWFCNDVFFYGNKLFQSSFIKVISDSPSSLLVSWEWSLLNIVVSLAGYYAASFLIDNRMYGRRMMQQVGFFMCFIMFVIPAFRYDYYTSPAGIHAFQAMYFLSSFFNQFGPNAVTFLVAGEVFPTEIRASAHGFAACLGKAGALLASVLYNYIDNRQKFIIVPWFGLAGMLLTWIWLPDTTGLDLEEQERRWQYILEGREHEYHGIAIHPHHLSMWERMWGIHKNYHPNIDLKAKIEDMKRDFLARDAIVKSEADIGFSSSADVDEDYTEEMRAYFRGQQVAPRNGDKIKEKGMGLDQTILSASSEDT